MNQTKRENSIPEIFRTVCEFVSDIFWPKRCIVCACRTPMGRKAAVCDDCKKSVKKLSFNFVEPDRYFEEAIAALPYSGNIRQSLMRYKFSGFKYLGKAFSEALSICLEDYDLSDYSLICPVPIHRLRQREYNQSLVIAKDIADTFGFTLCPDLLIKVKNLSPLSRMSYVMRSASVRGAIDFNLTYNISGKSILILDDIYTTGSTADECSKILMMHGAEKVTVIAACYADEKGAEDYGTSDNIPL